MALTYSHRPFGPTSRWRDNCPKAKVLEKIIVPRLMVSMQYILAELEKAERQKVFKLKQHTDSKKSIECQVGKDDEETEAIAQKPEKSIQNQPIILDLEAKDTDTQIVIENNNRKDILDKMDSLSILKQDLDIKSEIITPLKDLTVIIAPILVPNIIRKGFKTESELNGLQKNVAYSEKGESMILKELNNVSESNTKDLENSSESRPESETLDISDKINKDSTVADLVDEIYDNLQRYINQKINKSVNQQNSPEKSFDLQELETCSSKKLKEVPVTETDMTENNLDESDETGSKIKQSPKEAPDKKNIGLNGGDAVEVLHTEGLARISEAILPFAMLSLETMNEFDDLFDGEWDYLNNLPEIPMPKMDINTTLALSTMACAVGKYNGNKESMHETSTDKVTMDRPRSRSNNKKDSNKVIVIGNKKPISDTSSTLMSTAERTLEEIKGLILKMKAKKRDQQIKENVNLPNMNVPKTGNLNSQVKPESSNQKDDEKEMKVVALSRSNIDAIDETKSSPFNIKNKDDVTSKTNSKCFPPMEVSTTKDDSNNERNCHDDKYSGQSNETYTKLKSVKKVDKIENMEEENYVNEKKFVKFIDNTDVNQFDIKEELLNHLDQRANITLENISNDSMTPLNKHNSNSSDKIIKRSQEHNIVNIPDLDMKSLSKDDTYSGFGINSIDFIEDSDDSGVDYGNNKQSIKDITFADLDTVSITKADFTIVNNEKSINDGIPNSQESFSETLAMKSTNSSRITYVPDSVNIDTLESNSSTENSMQPFIIKSRCAINDSRELYGWNSSGARPQNITNKEIDPSQETESILFPGNLIFISNEDMSNSPSANFIDDFEMDKTKSRHKNN